MPQDGRHDGGAERSAGPGRGGAGRVPGRVHRPGRYAATGTGKTTALSQLGRACELAARKRHPQDRHRLPVVYITVPPAATPRMVAVEFARFFGLPAPARANLTDVTNAVCATAAHTRVDLVLVDEIHNISLATRAGAEYSQFSAARIFAAAYPEAVTIASLIASPAWRCLAAGNPAQQQKFIAAIGQRLGWPGYQPPDTGDAIVHWMKYDSRQPPSRPHTTFPQAHGYGPARRVTTSMQSLRRHERSTQWFRVYRRGGRVILHHSHVWPV